MTGNAQPHFLWRGWAPAVAFLTLVVLVVSSLAYTRHESRRHDITACKGQRQGRAALVQVLEETADFFEPLVDTPEGHEYIALLRRRVKDLGLPLACEKELGLVKP